MTKFLLVGSGWRAEYFLRVALALPERFHCAGVVTSNPHKQDVYRSQGFQVFGGRESGLQQALDTVGNEIDFAVVSVTASAHLEVGLNLIRRGVRVLMETPAAGTPEDLEQMYIKLQEVDPERKLFQLAENYPFRPEQLSHLAIISSGILGEVSFAQVSFTNTYHAVAMIRSYLGEGTALEELHNTSPTDSMQQLAQYLPKIDVQKFTIPALQGFSRTGKPQVSQLQQARIQVTHNLSTLQFRSGKVGVYSFEDAQHRSYIRSPYILIKGEFGQIESGEFGTIVKWQTETSRSNTLNMTRVQLGQNHDVTGFGLQEIRLGEQVLWENPYLTEQESHQLVCALSDDEIACATLLEKMVQLIETGKNFYSIDQAYLDTQIGFSIG
jgi:hypothetical protein